VVVKSVRYRLCEHRSRRTFSIKIGRLLCVPVGASKKPNTKGNERDGCGQGIERMPRRQIKVAKSVNVRFSVCNFAKHQYVLSMDAVVAHCLNI
jgi:hypothetical protein